MTTISGTDLLAIESLRADVARLTAERDEALAARDVYDDAAINEIVRAASLKTDLASRDATIAELRALLLEAVRLGLAADEEGWPQPTVRSERLHAIGQAAKEQG